MFAACSKDTTEDINLSDKCLQYDTLYVFIEDGDSRTFLDKNYHTAWRSYDNISVFNKTNINRKWTFNGKSGDRCGTFSTHYSDDLPTTNKVVALYPYDPLCTVNGYMISTTIPSEQRNKHSDEPDSPYSLYTHSFGDGGDIMVAVSDDNNLQFKHIFGWIKLSITYDTGQEAPQFITFSGNNNEKLTGNITIDTSTQKVYMKGNNTSTITLYPGYCPTSPAVYYIAIIPQTFKKGITVTAHFNDGSVFEKSTNKTIKIERNHIVPMSITSICDPVQEYLEIQYVSSDKRTICNINENEEINNYNSWWWASVISNTYDTKNNIGTLVIPKESSIGFYAFYDCDNLKSIIIPDGITLIESCAFESCNGLTSVTLPNSITEIGGNAFYNCNSLKNINIPNSVTTIWNYAFFGCKSLKSITIPDSVNCIKDNAFRKCSNLENVTVIGNGRTIIEWSAFQDCSNLTNITIGTGVAEIHGGAFQNCSSLRRINIPNSITSISSEMFKGCKRLQNITIPNSITSIEESAFKDCGCLTSITIPNSVKTIGKSAFYGCLNLTNVTIPDSVTSIGDWAFYNCNQLTSVTIGKSITSIELSTFYCCNNLETIYCKPATPPILHSDMPVSVKKIYVPMESVDAYKSATIWNRKANTIEGYNF